MKAPARRKVSYVVEATDGGRAHRLGVNSLALDSTVHDTCESTGVGGILYSAGRDGVVAGWDLHLPFKRTKTDDLEENDNPSITSDGQWVLDREHLPPKKASCRVFSQMHTDWVNDIALCRNGNFVVSASSDRTVKLWAVHGTDAHTIGWHTDYVKCLASASKAGWVASGGFDKKINIWDVERCQAVLTMNASANASDESLDSTSSDRHHAASKASVYAMAVNPSGTLLATGSPEKIVRLWDPRTGKHIGRLTGHTDNIRALLLSHDGTHVLSGSSDSTIKLWSLKAQRCITTYETHPDSVWALYSEDPDLRTFYAGSRDALVTRTEVSGHGDSENSECIALFKEQSGVVKLVAYNDTYVWTATSSSNINRWLSIPSRASRQVLTRSEYNPEIPTSAVMQLPPPMPRYHSQIIDTADNLTLYAGSVMSIPISYQDDDMDSDESLLPIRDSPDSVIEGKPGVSTHMVLQNRRHVLTQNTEGVVALWDLVNCVQIKIFGKRKLDEVAQEVNSMDSFPPWCTVDTKIGAITVQLDGFTCFDCEMYADEIGVPEGYEIKEDQRVNLGKWVLAHLFSEFIAAKMRQQQEKQKSSSSPSVEERRSKDQVQSSPSNKRERPVAKERQIQKPPLTAISTNIKGFRESPASPSGTTVFNGPFTAPPSTSSQQHDYFSGTHPTADQASSPVQIPPPAALPASPVSPTGSTNFINRLKNLSVKAKLSKSPSPDEASSHESYEGDDKDNSRRDSTTASRSSDKDAEVLTPPDLSEFPPLSIPSSTTIMITEESAEASTGMDVYRGTLATVGMDVATIEKVAPQWLLTYLYHNKTPSKDTVKLTFNLKPHPGSSLPELPGGPNNRLLANRILRARKLVQYVAEKLELDATTDPIELLCCDTVLAPTMTLAAIKQHIMKSGGDILLTYRYVREGSST